MATKKSVFETLNDINVSNHIEKKGQLSYLSWSWAWQTVKKAYPLTQYKVYENINGLNYHTDGQTVWVKASVTIEDLEHIEYLPVMDFKNKSVPVSNVTSTDVNKAIQRALTKSIARHGLGLYIYVGEDLPEADKNPLISNEVHQELRQIIQDKKLDYMEVCKAWNFKNLSELQASSIVSFKEWLGKSNG